MSEHLNQSTLAIMLEEAAELVAIGADYVHYKDEDKVYKTLGLAILESTDEVCVTYRAQYGKHLIFIRPVSNWIENVEKDGKQIKRFTKVGPHQTAS